MARSAFFTLSIGNKKKLNVIKTGDMVRGQIGRILDNANHLSGRIVARVTFGWLLFDDFDGWSTDPNFDVELLDSDAVVKLMIN